MNGEDAAPNFFWVSVIHQRIDEVLSPVRLNLAYIALVGMTVNNPRTCKFVKFRFADQGCLLGVRCIEFPISGDNFDVSDDVGIKLAKLVRWDPVLPRSG